MEKAQNSIIFAQELDGKGGSTTIEEANLKRVWTSPALTWIHFNMNASKTEEWLTHDSGLPPIIVETLLGEDTRPRSLAYNDGILLVSRGVNLNQGAAPEDMIVLKMWVQPNNIITLRSEKSFFIQDIIELLEAHKGPVNASEFIVEVLEAQLVRIGKVVDAAESTIEMLDEAFISPDQHTESKIKEIREKALRLRRYLAPQKDVVLYVSNLHVKWLNCFDKMRLQEMADRIAHYVEELELIERKASFMQDEINAKYTRELNSKIYLLAVLTLIFSPLSLVGTIFGVNLAGIPLANDPNAFYYLCGLLSVISIAMTVFLKRKKWI